MQSVLLFIQQTLIESLLYADPGLSTWYTAASKTRLTSSYQFKGETDKEWVIISTAGVSKLLMEGTDSTYFRLAGHTVFLTTPQLYCCGMEGAIENT